MARLWQTGFELNSITAGVEIENVTGSNFSIVTSPVRSGNYALKITSSNAASEYIDHRMLVGTGAIFTRVCLYINALPSGSTAFIQHVVTNGNALASIAINSNGTLSLYDGGISGTLKGSSGTLKLNTWYTVELKTNKTDSSQCIARLDTVQFAAGSYTDAQDCQTVRIGTLDFVSNAVIYIDDLAFNDSSGSSQNSWCGLGSIVHLKPSAPGDSNSFAVQAGGTAGSSNNFTRVDEITPDDSTSYNGSIVLNQEDLFNCDNFTGGAFGLINVVAIGARFADLVSTDATTGIKLEIIKVVGGTKSQSANIVPNSTTFVTNAPASPFNYSLVLYSDPDGVPWGQSTLDSMQIGYIIDAVNIQTVAVTTIWASIDFSPAPQGTTTSTSSTSSTSSSISSTSNSTSSTSTSASTTSVSTSSTSSSISISSTSSSISSTSSSISSTSSSSTSSSTSTSSTSSSISSTSQSSTSQSSTSQSTSVSSTSSSISSTSSSISSTSNSTSSTSVSSTSSSSSTSTTAIPLNLDYSYQDKLTLPTTPADDIDPDTDKNVMNVSIDDGDYFIQYGSEYMVQEFKKQWTNNTDVPTFTWKGRSTESTLISAILIQIYNVNSAAWETLSRITNQPADTDWTFSVSQSANPGNYYDTRNIVTFRVYQQVF